MDFSRFALKLKPIAWSDPAATVPTVWEVIAPDETNTGGPWTETMQENFAKRYADPTFTNSDAASIGWPLPYPDKASVLERRTYPGGRFSPGQILTDRRDAALFAPGEFPDVDTSTDPPQFYHVAALDAALAGPEREIVQKVVPRVLTTDAPIGDGVEVVHAALPSSIAWREPRQPQAGDRVIVADWNEGRERYVEGVVAAVATAANGHREIVLVDGEWRRVVAWVEP